MRLPLSLVAATAFATMVSACGLQPLYGGGTGSAVAQNLGSIDVEPIAGRSGWLLRNALNDRLSAMGGGSQARYRLVIKLDDRIEGFGVISNDQVTRERRTLRARYQLVDLNNGETVLDATAGSDAGIDIVSSEYATIAAEDRALENLALDVADRIILRLSLFAREGAVPTGNGPESGQ